MKDRDGQQRRARSLGALAVPRRTKESARHRTASVRLQRCVPDLAAVAGAERSATAPWEDVGSRP